jgi:hypothetical protein
MSARGALVAAVFISLACGTARAQEPPRICQDIKGDVTEADIRCAVGRWLDLANAHLPNGVTALYARNNVLLLSTLHAQPYTTTAQIQAYFEGLVTKQDFSVRLNDYPEKIDLFTTGGADSGFYTFRWITGPVETVTPARFTFVFRLDPTGKQLVIATHHSSALPVEHKRGGKRLHHTHHVN